MTKCGCRTWGRSGVSATPARTGGCLCSFQEHQWRALLESCHVGFVIRGSNGGDVDTRVRAGLARSVAVVTNYANYLVGDLAEVGPVKTVFRLKAAGGASRMDDRRALTIARRTSPTRVQSPAYVHSRAPLTCSYASHRWSCHAGMPATCAVEPRVCTLRRHTCRVCRLQLSLTHGPTPDSLDAIPDVRLRGCAAHVGPGM
jgi:hypothetical protein